MIARRSARIGRGWAYISNLGHRSYLVGLDHPYVPGLLGKGIPAYVPCSLWGPSSKNDERRPVTASAAGPLSRTEHGHSRRSESVRDLQPGARGDVREC